MSQRENGTVKWFDAKKGFGFVARQSGEDLFVHFRSIQGAGFKTLKDGQQVSFVVGNGPKGLSATEVEAID